jgi:hypothetical protein
MRLARLSGRCDLTARSGPIAHPARPRSGLVPRPTAGIGRVGSDRVAVGPTDRPPVATNLGGGGRLGRSGVTMAIRCRLFGSGERSCYHRRLGGIPIQAPNRPDFAASAVTLRETPARCLRNICRVWAAAHGKGPERDTDAFTLREIPVHCARNICSVGAADRAGIAYQAGGQCYQ